MFHAVQREMGKEMWLRVKRVGLQLVLCNLHPEAFPSFHSNRKPPVTVLWEEGLGSQGVSVRCIFFLCGHLAFSRH